MVCIPALLLFNYKTAAPLKESFHPIIYCPCAPNQLRVCVHVSVCLSVCSPWHLQKNKRKTKQNQKKEEAKKKQKKTALLSVHLCGAATLRLSCGNTRPHSSSRSCSSRTADTHMLICDLDAAEGRRSLGGEGGSRQIALKLWPKSAHQSAARVKTG